jgi:drug/metabolite transporter (DMT)-like permease
LGRIISLNEGWLVWYRLLLSAVALWILALVRRQAIRIPKRDVLAIFGVGCIAALHWVTFYGSIKYANVSVGLLCFSAIGFFTALLEPLIFRHRVDGVELLLGLLVIGGIYFIFRVDPRYKTGILIGLLSSLLGSLFPVLNRKIVQRVPSETVTLYMISGGFLALSLLLPFYLWLSPAGPSVPDGRDWAGLLFLSLFCTVLAVNLSMAALKKISAFTVNLSYNLEPIYGIFLAFVLYREDRQFTPGFYAGMGCILLAIVLQMGRLWRREYLRGLGTDIPDKRALGDGQ